MDGQQQLFESCKAVLVQNDLGGWTRPAPGLYPHQWLWDSCFIAIGQRHYSVKRAQREIRSLFRGQWKNGMLPNIVMGKDYYYADHLWNSHVSKDAPKHVKTSGITQPPMIAEAIVKIGEKLSATERRAWYKETWEPLLKFHEWLYRERDPHAEGLVVLIHPWESGLDNTPSWMHEMHLNQLPLWIRLIKFTKLNHLAELLRKDTKYLPAAQRIDTIDALGVYSIARRLKRKKYESRLILRHSSLSIEDLSFNCILIRANHLLKEIAAEINHEIPGWLWERMKKAPHALELLWSESQQQYFSRNYASFELIEQPSIMTFLPLYAGTISKSRAAHLVELLESKAYATDYPVASVPKNSTYFQPHRYWQGPTWVNTNWMIIEGLNRYGFAKQAETLRLKTISLVRQHGPYEYFSPLDGSPVGAHPFSWTAALTIDLLEQS